MRPLLLSSTGSINKISVPPYAFYWFIMKKICPLILPQYIQIKSGRPFAQNPKNIFFITIKYCDCLHPRIQILWPHVTDETEPVLVNHACVVFVVTT